MKNKIKIPEERNETIRGELLRWLEGGGLTVGELSKVVGKSEKEIYDHLEQLQKSGLLVIIPAECSKCGYIFESREKVKKPSKCPRCKSTYIKQPLFTVASR
jgi:predicted Zn-ribbon and HTH transcriptional regulator